MNTEISKFLDEKKTLKSRIDKIDKLIDAFQAVCTHTKEDGSDAMEYEGHDSHYDYEKCTICGYSCKA